MLRVRRQSLVPALAGAVGLLVACRSESHESKAREISLLGTPPAAIVAETRNYRFGADDRAPLASGWSARNERDRRGRTFVWATAEEARFTLTVLRIEDKQALLTVRAAPSPGPQRIQVRVNDYPVAIFRAETDDREFRFIIPADALHVGQNEIKFHHAFVTPGPNPRDSRRFAAAYSSLLIGPECLLLRADGEPKAPRVERVEGRKSLLIEGPAAVTWRADIPSGARFVIKVAMPARSAGAAEVTLEARTEGEWQPLADTLVRRGWVLPTAVARLEADLAAVAGHRAELRVVVRPRACASPLTTVRLKRASILLQNDDGA
jgi:hypothetical protein